MTDRVVGDWRTGLALHGFDPVAYYTEAKATAGRPEFELVQGGLTWRFRNEGNLAAFNERPDIYAPQFGGYDPVAIGRGSITPGHPDYWLMYRDRVLLFHNSESLAAFKSDADHLYAEAQGKWPEIRLQFIP